MSMDQAGDAMDSGTHRALRLTAASAAAGGLLLNVLNLGFMSWVVVTGSTEALTIDVGSFVGDAFVALAWGVGFPVLALVMLVRVGERREVVMAALFLGVYSLWAGFGDSMPFDEEPWLPFVMIAGDVLAHSIGIRFTQLFPRPLSPADVQDLGPAWLGRPVGVILGALLDPRIFWAFAVTFETAFRLIPIPGPWALIHLLIWLTLGTLFLYASYVRGSEEDRRRIFWILEGVAVFLVVQVLHIGLWAVSSTGLLEVDLPLWANWLRAVSAWLTLGCFVMAVFYAGAFDSGMVLRRTTVLGISAGLAVLIFVTLESLLEELVAEAFGVQSRVGGILGGVAAAVAFQPLALRIDRVIGRLASEESSDAE